MRKNYLKRKIDFFKYHEYQKYFKMIKFSIKINFSLNLTLGEKYFSEKIIHSKIEKYGVENIMNKITLEEI